MSYRMPRTKAQSSEETSWRHSAKEFRLQAALYARRWSAAADRALSGRPTSQPPGLSGALARLIVLAPGRQAAELSESAQLRTLPHAAQLASALDRPVHHAGPWLLSGVRLVFLALSRLTLSPASAAEAEDLLARALALAAVGLYSRLELEAAREALRAAYCHAARGSRSRELRSMVLRRQARLACYAGELPKARRLLQRLAEIHRARGEGGLFARALMSLANTYAHAGHFEAATACCAIAVRRLDPVSDAPLLEAATLDLAWYSFEIDQPTAAAEALESFHKLRGAPPAEADALALRATWLEARLLIQRGERALGEARLRACREGYSRLEAALPTCLVTLELAQLLLVGEPTPERAGEIEELLASVVTLLRVRRCPQHRLAALLLVSKAASAGTLSAELVRQAMRSLAAPSGAGSRG